MDMLTLTRKSETCWIDYTELGNICDNCCDNVTNVANKLLLIALWQFYFWHRARITKAVTCCHIVVVMLSLPHCRCHIVVVMLSLSHCCCHIVDVTLSLLRCRCRVLRCSELLSSWQIDKTRSRWNEEMKIRRWRHKETIHI